jgi:hypothetical protein
MAASDFIGLIGVLVGGGIVLAGQVLQHSLKHRSARASARAIALAYVDGALKMDERRRHGELLHRPFLEALKAHGGFVPMPKPIGPEIYPNPNEVQKAVIGQLSHLEPQDARDMVMFLNVGDSLDANDAAMSTGKMDDFEPDQKIDFLERYLKLRQEMVELGHKLVGRLKGF